MNRSASPTSQTRSGRTGGDMSVKFDATFNVGHVVTAGSLVVTLIAGYVAMDYRLSSLERQVERLSAVVIDNARFDERLKDLTRRVERLEAGR